MRRALLRSAVSPRVQTRTRTLATAALLSFEEEVVPAVSLGPLSQTTDIQSSQLPNGVQVISTGAAASCVVAISVANVGTACGPPGAAFAAQKMAFKSANGKSDLAIQRGLELSGSKIHAQALKKTFVTAVECLPESADAAFDAAVTAAGVFRTPYVDWEFKETLEAVLKSNSQKSDPLTAAIEDAAYGGGPMGRPAATKAGLTALSLTDVFEATSDVVTKQGAPVTIVGVGLDHADVLAAAAKNLAALGMRDSAPSLIPSDFIPGGFSAKSVPYGTPFAMAVALPAPDKIKGEILAKALPNVTYSSSSGLLIAASTTASKADLLASITTNLDALTEADFQAAKNQVKLKTLSYTGVPLALALCDAGPTALDTNPIDALTLADCKAAFTNVEPAFAVLAPSED